MCGPLRAKPRRAASISFSFIRWATSPVTSTPSQAPNVNVKLAAKSQNTSQKMLDAFRSPASRPLTTARMPVYAIEQLCFAGLLVWEDHPAV